MKKFNFPKFSPNFSPNLSPKFLQKKRIYGHHHSSISKLKRKSKCVKTIDFSTTMSTTDSYSLPPTESDEMSEYLPYALPSSIILPTKRSEVECMEALSPKAIPSSLTFFDESRGQDVNGFPEVSFSPWPSPVESTGSFEYSALASEIDFLGGDTPREGGDEAEEAEDECNSSSPVEANLREVKEEVYETF
mmetsp:Transcript_40546/g.60757  ORF Transcript_40546/g.60757 Transcript_40546/m.60757 type:complete len:191 (-) Transcript_40546:140-712(-)